MFEPHSNRWALLAIVVLLVDALHGVARAQTGLLGVTSAPHTAAAVTPSQPLDADTRAWITGVRARLSPGDAATARSIADEAMTRASDPSASRTSRASLHLLAASALVQLAQLGESKQSNAAASYQELQKAIELAPDQQEVALAYGRSVLAVTKIGGLLRGLVRGFIEGALNVNVKSEATKAVGLLGQFPDDSMSQLVRFRLAEFVDDTAALADANQRLTALEHSVPESMREARDALDRDVGRAKTAR